MEFDKDGKIARMLKIYNPESCQFLDEFVKQPPIRKIRPLGAVLGPK